MITQQMKERRTKDEQIQALKEENQALRNDLEFSNNQGKWFFLWAIAATVTTIMASLIAMRL